MTNNVGLTTGVALVALYRGLQSVLGKPIGFGNTKYYIQCSILQSFDDFKDTIASPFLCGNFLHSARRGLESLEFQLERPEHFGVAFAFSTSMFRTKFFKILSTSELESNLRSEKQHLTGLDGVPCFRTKRKNIGILKIGPSHYM